MAATSFSYWARNILAWGLPVMLAAPFIPLAWPRLGVLADVSFLFRSGAFLFFSLAIVVAWNERLQFRSLAVWAAATGVLSAVVLASVTAADPARAFWGDMVRQEGLLHACALAAYAVACTVAFRDRTAWHRFAAAAVGIGLFAAVHAAVWPIVSYFIGGDEPSRRLWGVYVNPLYFGMVMAVTAWIAMSLAGSATTKRSRVLFGAAAVLLAYMAIMSGSRSIFLALGASGLCVLFLYVRASTRLPIAMIGASGAVLLAFAYGLLRFIHLWVRFDFPLLSRITNISLVDQRWQIWQIYLPAIQERWLTGWGPENQLVAYYAHFLPHLYAHTFEIFDRAHNGALDAVLTTGAVGLVATACLGVCLMWYWGRKWFRDRSWLALTVLGAAVFSFVSVQFVFDTVFSWIVLIPFFVAPLAERLWLGSSKKTSLAFPMLGVSVAVMAWIMSVLLPFLALHQTRTAYVRSQTDLRAGAHVYRAAYKLPSGVRTEVAKMWATAVREAIVLRRGDPGEVQAAGEGALAALMEEHRRHPWDPSIPLATVRLLEGLTELFPAYAERIEPLLSQTITAHPNRIEAYQMLALRALRDGRLNLAAQLLQSALRINDDVAQTHLEYAVVLSRQGKIAQALWSIGRAVQEDGNALDPAARLYAAIIRSPATGPLDGNVGGVMEPGNVPAE